MLTRKKQCFNWIGALAILLLASSAFALQGGADGGYGYHYIDSREANGPKYKWYELDEKGDDFVDLTKKVSSLTLTSGFPIGFNFEFYGKKYNYFYISGNGYITFEYKVDDPASYSYKGQEVPSKQMPVAFLAPFWGSNNIEK